MNNSHRKERPHCLKSEIVMRIYRPIWSAVLAPSCPLSVNWGHILNEKLLSRSKLVNSVIQYVGAREPSASILYL